MTAHLTEDALMDVLDGAGAPDEREHAARCAGCRERIAEARAALEIADLADVPEPPPMYWEALRRNVDRRIAEEPRRRWGALWLAPIAVAAAALLVAVGVGRTGLRPTAAPTAAVPLPAWSALPPEAEDPRLPALVDLAQIEGESATWDDGRGLTAFVADLSDEERQALVDALLTQGEEAEL